MLTPTEKHYQLHKHSCFEIEKTVARVGKMFPLQVLEEVLCREHVDISSLFGKFSIEGHDLSFTYQQISFGSRLTRGTRFLLADDSPILSLCDDEAPYFDTGKPKISCRNYSNSRSIGISNSPSGSQKSLRASATFESKDKFPSKRARFRNCSVYTQNQLELFTKSLLGSIRFDWLLEFLLPGVFCTAPHCVCTSSRLFLIALPRRSNVPFRKHLEKSFVERFCPHFARPQRWLASVDTTTSVHKWFSYAACVRKTLTEYACPGKDVYIKNTYFRLGN